VFCARTGNAKMLVDTTKQINAPRFIIIFILNVISIYSSGLGRADIRFKLRFMPSVNVKLSTMDLFIK